MRQVLRRSLWLVLGLSLCFGCASSDKPEPKSEPKMVKWWNYPGNIELRGYVAAFVGVANNVFNNLSAARRAAEADAREKIAKFLQVKIQSLAEYWDKQTGDLLKKGSLASFVNNESFRREFVNTTIRGAIPLQYHQEGNQIYVLVGLKAKDFMDKFVSQIESKLDTMILTDAMKEQARQRLEKLVKQEEEKLNKKAKFVIQGSGLDKKIVPAK